MQGLGRGSMKDLCQPDNRNVRFNISLDNLRNSLNAVPISVKVPNKIRTMVEFAQKIFLYSFYEYDFYALAMIYLALMTETAIKERFLMELPDEIELEKKERIEILPKIYAILFDHLAANWKMKNLKKVNGSLKSVMDWLFKRIEMPDRFNAFTREALRIIRNFSAHLTGKDIYQPAVALPFYQQTVDFINCLFECDKISKKPI